MGKARILELCGKYPRFPLLMANVQWADDEKEVAKRIPPYRIFKLEGVTVAVIGTGSHDMRYARKERFAVGYQPAAIHHWVPILRKKADIVIAVTHQYEGSDHGTASGPNAPDLIVGGHSHGAYARPYGKEKKCYIIKVKAYCRLLGVVKIKWDGERIVECTGELLDVRKADWPDDPKVKALRKQYFDAFEASQGKDD
jgi:2',3'-cyclic-nucleotide 2'-phosphodiesterase (5'-nucleotidase family)